MTFYNGDKYSGEFSNSQMTGYGCYSMPDGTKMIGHFDDGPAVHGLATGLSTTTATTATTSATATAATASRRCLR